MPETPSAATVEPRQKVQVAQETIEEMPYEWGDVWGVIKECVRTKLIRFLEAGDDGN